MAARQALVSKKAESNLKVLQPGSIAWQVLYPRSQGAPSQVSASQVGPSQGPVVSLQAAGGQLHWQQVGEPQSTATLGFSAWGRSRVHKVFVLFAQLVTLD